MVAPNKSRMAFAQAKAAWLGPQAREVRRIAEEAMRLRDSLRLREAADVADRVVAAEEAAGRPGAPAWSDWAEAIRREAEATRRYRVRIDGIERRPVDAASVDAAIDAACGMVESEACDADFVATVRFHVEVAAADGSAKAERVVRVDPFEPVCEGEHGSHRWSDPRFDLRHNVEVSRCSECGMVHVEGEDGEAYLLPEWVDRVEAEPYTSAVRWRKRRS